MMDAYEELMDALEDGEVVEAVCFGAGSGASLWSLPPPGQIPKEMQEIPIQLEDAEPLMRNWSFEGDFGSAECYAIYIWTDRRIGFCSRIRQINRTRIHS